MAEGKTRLRLRTITERVAALGARADDTREDRLRKGSLLLAACLITILSVVWVATYLTYGLVLAAAIPFSYQVLTVIGLIFVVRTKRFAPFQLSQLTLFLALPFLLQIAVGGFLASSGVILWAAVTPLAALALLGVRRAAPWLVTYLALLVLLGVLDPAVERDVQPLPDAIVLAFFVLNITGVSVSSFLMLGYFVTQVGIERERSERLLLNVLPAEIAERLKDGEGVIAERFDDVTVLFADLVGFTKLAEGMDPHDLVSLLDEVFTSFDALADEAGLEKIKTIGDAYMVAGGLPKPLPGHPEAVARMAVAMRAALAEIAVARSSYELALRIGIDTGPVVAGVIGRRRFIYDLWGDTVNTASRMESHGLANEIQVTERTADRLAGRFELRPRGTVEVKGKGPMPTFLLVEPSG